MGNLFGVEVAHTGETMNLPDIENCHFFKFLGEERGWSPFVRWAGLLKMLFVDSQCKEVPGTTEHIAAHSTSQNTLTLVRLCK